ncbi:MAG: DUF4407 domain-containing protein [Bacteroidetes bacterium]|nr:MAG: DUF4407 domain-containing protein [Bacteroidota bacterium]
MLRFVCFITGADAQILANSTPASRVKYRTMAIATLVPVLLWFFAGMAISNSILNNPWYWSALTACLMAFLVFIIERVVINGSKSWWSFCFRFVLALCSAYLCGIAIDSLVFQNDIDTQMVSVKQNHLAEVKANAVAEYGRVNNLAGLEKNLQASSARVQHAEAGYLQELTDGGGVGAALHGNGKVAKAKNNVRLQAIAAQNAAAEKIQQLQADAQAAGSKAESEAAAKFNNGSLLLRLKALHELVDSNPMMKRVYQILTCLLVLMEMMLLIKVFTSGECHYERLLAYQEWLGEQRLQRLKTQSDVFSPYANATLQEEIVTRQLPTRPRRIA